MGCRWDDDHCPREPGEPDDDAQDPDGLGGQTDHE